MAKIQCDFDMNSRLYECSVDFKIIPSSNFCFEGEHQESKNNDDVQKLVLTNCSIREFPKDFQEMFPNITSLYIRDCILDKIGREHIGKWTKLVKIIISECDIKILKGDIFRGLTWLKSIDLSNNLLEEIEPDIFDGLELLKTVNLYGNRNISISANSKSDIEELKEEIELKCMPKTINDSPSYFENQIKELKQKIHDLKIDKRNNDQLVKETMELKKQLAIMTDPAFKDFTINIDDSSFKVHKLIFAGRSETLAELFQNNPEATELNLRDIPKGIFQAVHDFIYTNQLPDDGVNYLEVFAAASRLKIDDLIEATANQLLNKIDENNSIEILELSNKFNHEKLREKAFEIIRTKIFPDRKIDDELAKDSEKLKKLIKMKKVLDEEFQIE